MKKIFGELNISYKVIILSAIIIGVIVGLLTSSLPLTIHGIIYSFPRHLISLILILSTAIIYPLAIFNNKKIKYTGLAISITSIIVFSIIAFSTNPYYETVLKCSTESFYYDDTYKIYLEDEKYGKINVEFNEELNTYCMNVEFHTTGETKLVIDDQKGNVNKYDLTISKNTFDLDIPEEEKSEEMNNTKIIINNNSYDIELENNETTNELLKKLPLEISMKELNGNEYYSYLDFNLKNNEEKVKNINAGDVMLYGDNCIVIFYKSFTTTYNYTRIGHINNIDNLKEDLEKGKVIFK